MSTTETLARVIDELCEGFAHHDLDRIVGLFAPDGVFDDLVGEPHKGHRAIRDVFAAMFAADPSTRYDLELRLIEPPAMALIVWTKHSNRDGDCSWWSGLDVLLFDDVARITSKSVYCKSNAPLVNRTGASV